MSLYPSDGWFRERYGDCDSDCPCKEKAMTPSKEERRKLGKANKLKGGNYERKIARSISSATGYRWKRTPYSGAGHISGDVFCLDFEFPFVVELKNRRDLSLLKVFKNPSVVSKYLTGWKLDEECTILIFNDAGTDICIVPFRSNMSTKYFYGEINIDKGRFIVTNLDTLCKWIGQNYEISHSI